MRKISVLVVTVAMPVVATFSAHGVVMAPAPSVALGNKPLASVVKGVERLVTQPIARRLPKVPIPPIPKPCTKFPQLCPSPPPPSASQAPDEVPAGNDGAECHFCLVSHQFTYWDYGDHEQLRVDYQRDSAKELIDTLHVHGVLLRIPQGNSDCYSDLGDYVYNKGADSSGPTDLLENSSQGVKYSGNNNRWNQTIGAQFWDGYGYWELLGGEIDMCKQF